VDRLWPALAPRLIFLVCLAVSGCQSAWEPRGTFTKPVQTIFDISSEPPASAYLNGGYAGRTPLALPVTYERLVERHERDVTHWQTNPVTSTAVTILSLGLYLPFSAIPVDEEERVQETDLFQSNEFLLELHAGGHEPWQRQISLHGEREVDIKGVLVPTS
jgi:hypothetical protein